MRTGDGPYMTMTGFLAKVYLFQRELVLNPNIPVLRLVARFNGSSDPGPKKEKEHIFTSVSLRLCEEDCH